MDTGGERLIYADTRNDRYTEKEVGRIQREARSVWTDTETEEVGKDGRQDEYYVTH